MPKRKKVTKAKAESINRFLYSAITEEAELQIIKAGINDLLDNLLPKHLTFTGLIFWLYKNQACDVRLIELFNLLYSTHKAPDFAVELAAEEEVLEIRSLQFLIELLKAGDDPDLDTLIKLQRKLISCQLDLLSIAIFDKTGQFLMLYDVDQFIQHNPVAKLTPDSKIADNLRLDSVINWSVWNKALTVTPIV